MDPIQPQREPDDSELVEALRHGDERAFVLLVNRYHPALVRVALAYVGDRAVAEDVAQEAWLGMLRGLDGFAGRASLRTWLFRILVNCARASQRRESRSVAFSDLRDTGTGEKHSVDPERFHPEDHRWAGHWSVPPQEWPEARTLAAEVGGCLEAALSHLPARQRAIMTLRDIEGWRVSEICTLLGITESNARVLLHRARAHVRRKLETYLAQPEGGTRL